MSKAPGIARPALMTLVVLASTSVARGDEVVRTRVTIRGSGSNVTIEETLAPVRKPVFERRKVPTDTLGEAIRLKTEGANDVTVVAYLRVHEAELPPIIEAAAMSRLRRAGAGKSVAAYLATVSAVDIGETGKGWGPAVSNAYAQETEAGMSAYDISYGYPVGGGYASPYSGRRRNAAFSHRHAPFPRHQPVFQRNLPMGSARGRRLIR